MKVLRWWAAGWGILLGLSGCAGYSLGPTNGLVARSQSIQVNYFQNDTLEPGLIQPLNAALRKNLQQEGTYRLATHHDGDIIVNGVISSYERNALSFQPTDILTVRDYRVNLIAHVKATERSTGRVLLDREVKGRTTLRLGPDVASADRQAIPLLADDLARNITSLLVDGSW